MSDKYETSGHQDRRLVTNAALSGERRPVVGGKRNVGQDRPDLP
jgi:hypothetical protein